MEGRKLKVIFAKSGSGSITPKTSLPITDLRDMGVIPEDREFYYHYDEKNKVMILSKEKIKEIKVIK